jgi:hypothetical protein
MDFLTDIITYVRRIVKTPSNASLSDNLIIDYVNRFWIMDVDARLQLFDLKTKYQFQTIPQVCDYNMPLYSVQTQPGAQTIAPYPVYQGFTGTSYVNGIQVPMYIQRDPFWKIWPNYLQALEFVAIGDGVTQTFQFNLPYFPSIPGHIDMTGIVANFSNSGSTLDPIFGTAIPNNAGNMVIPATSIYPGVFITYQNANGGVTTVTDSGVFLSGGGNTQLYGLLIEYSNPGSSTSPTNPFPLGYSPLGGNAAYSTTSNTVNYITGQVNVTFPDAPPIGAQIQAQSYYYQQGIPRAILFYNNCLTIRPPPDIPYLVELDAYLTPAAFLSSGQAVQFAYMSEYIARGAARKILSDTGDVEQFQFYEPLFKEQETLVWKRSQRIFTSQRTGTIFSDLQGPQSGISGIGQGAT